MDGKMLNIVDENDRIIGAESRDKIHQEGLLHREVHVYFVSPEKEFIFQHRARNKDTYPDMFDATVGGHVEIGETYLESAIKETREETGLELGADDLIFAKKLGSQSYDEKTGKSNNTFKSEFLYVYRGKMEDLRVEVGKAEGFLKRSITELRALDDQGRRKYISYCLDFILDYLIDFLKDKKI